MKLEDEAHLQDELARAVDASYEKEPKGRMAVRDVFDRTQARRLHMDIQIWSSTDQALKDLVKATGQLYKGYVPFVLQGLCSLCITRAMSPLYYTSYSTAPLIWTVVSPHLLGKGHCCLLRGRLLS